MSSSSQLFFPRQGRRRRRCGRSSRGLPRTRSLPSIGDILFKTTPDTHYSSRLPPPPTNRFRATAQKALDCIYRWSLPVIFGILLVVTWWYIFALSSDQRQQRAAILNAYDFRDEDEGWEEPLRSVYYLEERTGTVSASRPVPDGLPELLRWSSSSANSWCWGNETAWREFEICGVLRLSPLRPRLRPGGAFERSGWGVRDRFIRIRELQKQLRRLRRRRPTTTRNEPVEYLDAFDAPDPNASPQILQRWWSWGTLHYATTIFKRCWTALFATVWFLKVDYLDYYVSPTMLWTNILPTTAVVLFKLLQGTCWARMEPGAGGLAFGGALNPEQRRLLERIDLLAPVPVDVDVDVPAQPQQSTKIPIPRRRTNSLDSITIPSREEYLTRTHRTRRPSDQSWRQYTETTAAPESDVLLVVAGRSEDEETQCIICYDRTAEVKFLPCGHTCCCVACARRIVRANPRCPLDRTPIEDCVRELMIVEDATMFQ